MLRAHIDILMSLLLLPCNYQMFSMSKSDVSVCYFKYSFHFALYLIVFATKNERRKITKKKWEKLFSNNLLLKHKLPLKFFTLPACVRACVLVILLKYFAKNTKYICFTKLIKCFFVFSIYFAFNKCLNLLGICGDNFDFMAT